MTLNVVMLVSLLTLPLTYYLWKVLVHDVLAKQLADARGSDALALLLVDVLGAVVIMFGPGFVLAALAVN